MVNSLLSDKYDSPDALGEIDEEEEELTAVPTDDLHRDLAVAAERGDQSIGVTEELGAADSRGGSMSSSASPLSDGMASAIRTFVAALLQSVVESSTLDGNAVAGRPIAERSQGLVFISSDGSCPPDGKRIAAPEPPKRMHLQQVVPFKRVRAKIEWQQLTTSATDLASSEAAEEPPVDTITIDNIPAAISCSSSKTQLLLGFSLPSKRGIINKADDPKRKQSVLVTGSTGSSSRSRSSSMMKQDSSSTRDASSYLPHSSLSSAPLIVDNSQHGLRATRTQRMVGSTRQKTRSKRVSGSSSKGKGKGLFADKSGRYGKKIATAVSSSSTSSSSSQRRDVSSNRIDDDDEEEEKTEEEEEEDTDSSVQSSSVSLFFQGNWSSGDGINAAATTQSACMVERHNDEQRRVGDYQPSSSSFDDEDDDSCSSEYVDIVSDTSFSKDEDGETIFTSAQLLLDDDHYDDDDDDDGGRHVSHDDRNHDRPPDINIIPVAMESVDPQPVSGPRKVDLVNEHQIRITSTAAAASRSLPSVDTSVDTDTFTEVKIHHAKDDIRGGVRSRGGGVVEQMLSRVQSAATAQAHHHHHNHRSKASEHALSHFQKYHIPFLSQPSHGGSSTSAAASASQSDNPLAGIWPYDPSLAAFNALLSLVKMRQRSDYARKEWLQKKKKKTKTTFDRSRKAGAQRMPYPLKYYNRYLTY